MRPVSGPGLMVFWSGALTGEGFSVRGRAGDACGRFARTCPKEEGK